MNRFLRRTLLAAAIIASMQSCIRIGIRTHYRPLYFDYEELRAGISSTEPTELSEVGKIYVKDDLLFVNELHAGVHVIDNANPEAPVPLAFIPIPGNVDIAVRGDVLYADSYVNLVAIDVSDPDDAVEVGRVEDAFPYDPWLFLPFAGFWNDDVYETPDEEEGVVIGWEKSGSEIYLENALVVYETLAGSGGGAGTGGSLARFAVVDEWLYALHGSELKLYSLATPAEPAPGNPIDVAWDIETIFPYGDNLFIGSMSGMYIYDNTDPSAPTLLGEFAHATSCDPVVVEADTAYVTLRSGALCGGTANQLDVIDISDLEAPELVLSYALDGPYGLGIDGDTLFVCDGDSGVKIFDVSSGISLTSTIATLRARDVILLPPVAIVVGPDGIDQFDYTNPAELVVLSHLDVVQTN